MTHINRRRALAVVAAVPVAAALGTSALAAVQDAIFAAIAAHKSAYKKFDQLWVKLDEAEGDARDRFGLRPLELVQWRNYHIGEYEIDRHREWYLNQGEDPKQVEAEYQDAKRRYREVVQAGREWDKRIGIAPLRQEVARADRAANTAAKALAKTKPATPHGARPRRLRFARFVRRT